MNKFKKIMILFTILIVVIVSITIIFFITYDNKGEIVGTDEWAYLEVLSYGVNEAQNMNITLPLNGIKSTTAIVFIHGYNDGILEYPKFLERYRYDFITAAINYRTFSVDMPEVNIDELLSEVNSAIIMLKETSEAHKIYVNNIVLVGHSLGGMLALLYSYGYFVETHPIPVIFCISLAAPTDWTDPSFISSAKRRGNKLFNIDGFTKRLSVLTSDKITEGDMGDFGFSESARQSLKKVSARYYVNENFPPTIIVHDTQDELVPFSNSVTLVATLEMFNIPHIFISSTNNLKHGLGMNMFNYQELSVSYNENLTERLIEAINKFIELYSDNNHRY